MQGPSGVRATGVASLQRKGRRVTTHIEIDGRSFPLGTDQDLVAVMAQIEAAAADPPAFVTLVGDREAISVLIRPTTRVVISKVLAGHAEAEQPPWGVPWDDWEM